MGERSRRVVNQELRKDVAKLLDSGYALTRRDLGEMFAERGASYATGASVGSELLNGGFTQKTGIWIASEVFNQKKIFYNADLPREDTDIEEVKARLRES